MTQHPKRDNTPKPAAAAVATQNAVRRILAKKLGLPRSASAQQLLGALDRMLAKHPALYPTQEARENFLWPIRAGLLGQTEALAAADSMMAAMRPQRAEGEVAAALAKIAPPPIELPAALAALRAAA
jgi:hypothetical protein